MEIKTLYDLTMSEKWNFYAGTTVLLISSMITLSFPFGIGQIIDSLTNSKDILSIDDKLYDICFSIFSVFCIQCFCTFLRYFLLDRATERITTRIKTQVFSAILQQEMSFFDENASGELINRLSEDTKLLSSCVTKNLATGFKSVFVAIFGLYMMFTVSPALSLKALYVVPPLSAGTFVMGYYLRKTRKEVQERVAQTTQVAHERIANLKTVRAFCREEREIEKYRSNCESVLEVSDKEITLHAAYHAALDMNQAVLITLLVYYGGNLLYNKEITGGTLTTFMLYSRYVGHALKDMSNFYTNVMTGLGASTRITEIIERIPKIPIKGGEIPSESISGNIRFHSVSFSYPSRPDYPVLSEVNLDIPAGSVLAIVGNSGEGKTTLGALLLRFYDPTSGIIKLDGQDISKLDPEWLRQQIGCVAQEPALFSGTIRDNILYGVKSGEDVSDQLIYKVSKDANALEFILRFPDKFETLVGERGIMLSGGQRQRIAIARSLIKNPKILLFDEATSALDAESENLVQEALERVALNRTVIIIAHRLSTIRNADKIAVVAEGKFAEIGAFNDLMTIPYGKFRKLVEKQTIDKQN